MAPRIITVITTTLLGVAAMQAQAPVAPAPNADPYANNAAAGTLRFPLQRPP